jgi:hypothetical protein
MLLPTITQLNLQELGRALHMALYVWEPDGILTNACDNDIQSLCLEDRPNMARTPGAVNTCLKEIVSGIQELACAT